MVPELIFPLIRRITVKSLLVFTCGVPCSIRHLGTLLTLIQIIGAGLCVLLVKELTQLTFLVVVVLNLTRFTSFYVWQKQPPFVEKDLTDDTYNMLINFPEVKRLIDEN